MRSWCANLLAIWLLLLASCASETASAPPVSGSTAPTDTSVTNGAHPTITPALVPETSVTTAATAPANPPAVTTAVAEPVQRPAENPGAASGGHWIGRGAMSEDEVELVWAPVAPGAGDVRYLVYRVPSLGVDLESVDVQKLTRVYAGGDTMFVDRTVEPNTFYSYILVAEVDGLALSRRWTNALTVTDTEPPAEVQIVSIETTSDGVTLCWSPSSDNVEFAAYSVSLVQENGELQYLGGGADLGQTCFVDTRPPPGSATYAVQAVDFHDNRSEPVRVTVEG